MNQFLSLKQLDKITDYSEILEEAEKLKTEISKTKNFLLKFGLNVNFGKIFSEVNKQNPATITTREKARLYYLLLKVALIDCLLIVSDNQLNAIFEIYHENPALFNRRIQGARITPENRHEIVQNLVLYLAFSPGQQSAHFEIFSQNNKN
jgi:hypothetical protein